MVKYEVKRNQRVQKVDKTKKKVSHHSNKTLSRMNDCTSDSCSQRVHHLS